MTSIRFSNQPRSKQDFKNKRVVVFGLGLFGGGVGLTQFLCDQGANVLVTDLRDEKALSSSIEALKGYSIEWVLGEHRENDLFSADIIFVNPAVPRTLPLLLEAQDRNVELETEMNLFFKLAPGKIAAITGSNGKTTTTSLAHAMVKAHAPNTRLGGNMGISLLNDLEMMTENDWSILELSSFQLEDLASIDRRPDVSLVTNLSPNHLNRHGTYEAYKNAKKVIIESQTGSHPGIAILNADDEETREWSNQTDRELYYYGEDCIPNSDLAGVFALGQNALKRFHSQKTEDLFNQSDLTLMGRFNFLNACGAACLASCVGVPSEAIQSGTRNFRAIEHRLEFVREFGQVRFYNDSIATTPESTIKAIDALGPEVILIVGGSDKGSSFKDLAAQITDSTRATILIGETAGDILKEIRTFSEDYPVQQAQDLQMAVDLAQEMARPGDRIALSPACASLDMFTHFEERGLRFKTIVHGLEEKVS